MPDQTSFCYVARDSVGPHGGIVYESTDLSRASWYENGQHGGVVSGLMVRAVERTPSLQPMEVARATVELFRVVPVAPVEVVATIVREGKKIQTTQVLLYHEDVELARALVQRLRVTDLGEDFENGPAPPQLNEAAVVAFGDVMPFPDDGRAVFGRTALDFSPVRGNFAMPGDNRAWFRITASLVSGEEPTPTQRAMVMGDFANAVTRKRQPNDVVFMNSDLSVRLMRLPRGEWIHLAGDSLWGRAGRGAARTVMSDPDGVFAYAEQTLFLDNH